MRLLAEFSIWPLVILWVVAMLLGGKKKKPAPRSSGAAGEGPAPQGLLGQLNQALQELKRAEQEAVAKRLGVDPARLQSAAPKPAPKPAGAAAYRLGTRGEGAKAVKRQVYNPKGAAGAKPARVAPRPVEYDPDQSFEDPTVISLERLDYDEDAEKLVQSRIAAAERRDASREDTSVEALSAEQIARRADRAPAEAIGGKAQHEAWHLKRDAMIAPAPAAKPRARGLARFGGGRVRDAIVLSEILGGPKGLG